MIGISSMRRQMLLDKPIAEYRSNPTAVSAQRARSRRGKKVVAVMQLRGFRLCYLGTAQFKAAMALEPGTVHATADDEETAYERVRIVAAEIDRQMTRLGSPRGVVGS